jgi:hypothetical protein
LLAAIGVAVGLRIPELYNSTPLLNSDEAVNALVIRHLVAGRELALFPWDVSYYGIVEGLLALPFAAVLGFTPLAFKLSALTGLVLLQLAAFRLGRQLYGAGAGLAAAWLLAAFSAQLVSWSTLAVGGICLVIALGTFAACRLYSLGREPTPWRAASLGLLIGLGAYVHELFLVYVVTFVVWGVGARVAARGVRPPWRLAASFAGGLALGLLPKAAPLLHGRMGGKTPAYHLASPGVAAGNLHLLLVQCVPALFGVHTGGHPSLRQEVGPSWPGAGLVGALLLAFYAGAYLWRARPALRRWLTADAGTAAETFLVVLVPVTALLFILSPNPQSVLSFHYLLPWLSSLAVFGGAALAVVARRSRPAAAALALLLVALPAAQIVAWYRKDHLLDSHLRLARMPNRLMDVLDYLDGRGFRGAYGWYWIAYRATMLSGERIIVAPLADWDRYPAYTRFVGQLPRVAYLFEVDFARLRRIESEQARRRYDDFLSRLQSAGASWEEARFGTFLVVHGRHGERLLPADFPGQPVRLASPRADVALGEVPPRAGPAAWLRVPARFTNRSDAPWSATGLPLAAGSLRVTAAYRWFDTAGHAVVEYGERSLLPGDVRPGEAMPMTVRVKTPDRPGAYDLEVTLVQDDVAWFDQATGSASPRRRVEVSGGGASVVTPRTRG